MCQSSVTCFGIPFSLHLKVSLITYGLKTIKYQYQDAPWNKKLFFKVRKQLYLYVQHSIHVRLTEQRHVFLLPAPTILGYIRQDFWIFHKTKKKTTKEKKLFTSPLLNSASVRKDLAISLFLISDSLLIR